MLSRLRPYVGKLKKLLAWPYLKLGFSPSQVGLAGIFFAVLAAVSLRIGVNQIAFWLAMAAFATDMADGEVARETNAETPLGNYVDAVGDRLKEGILLFGLAPFHWNLVSLAMLGSFLTSFAKARTSLVLVTDNRDWRGLGDHADRGVAILFCYLLAPSNLIPILVLNMICWTCFLTRVKTAKSMIENASNDELLPYLRCSTKYQR